MNNYLILPLSADPLDEDAVNEEVQQIVSAMRTMQMEATHNEVVEKFGNEVAQWVFTTNMNTLKSDFALKPDGKLLLGLHGDPLF